MMSAPEEVGLSSDRLARIEPAMQRWIDKGTILGAEMAIARRGQVVFHQCCGHLDINKEQPLPTGALYRIYSMTKPIVCTALMTLYEEGNFQLFTELSKFLPAFGQVKVLSANEERGLREEPVDQPILIGDLMKHTSGLTYDFLEDNPAAGRYRQTQLMANAGRTLTEFCDELARLPLAFHPDSRYHYSVGIDVVAHLIEVISGQPLRDFLKERLFEPLGMVDTDFGVVADQRHRLADMVGVGDLAHLTGPQMEAAWRRGVLVPIDPADSYPVDRPEIFQRGGHGLYSTVADYLRFSQMLLNNGQLDGVRILGRKTVELMHTNHLPHRMLPYEIGGIYNPGYGFGLGSRVLLNVGLARRPGTIDEFGWGGAASTYYWIDPAEELIGVFMTQYQGVDDPASDFRVLVYQAIVD